MNGVKRQTPDISKVIAAAAAQVSYTIALFVPQVAILVINNAVACIYAVERSQLVLALIHWQSTSQREGTCTNLNLPQHNDNNEPVDL